MVYKVLDSFCDLQRIMGKNFVNPLDWHRSLQIALSAEQRQAMFRFPWDLSLLEKPCPFQPEKKIAETHLLFWGWSQYSILSIAANFQGVRLPYLSDLQNKAIQVFQEKLVARWHLMPLHGQALIDSQKMPFEDHLRLVPKGYVTARAVEEMAKQLFFFLVNHSYPAEAMLYEYVVYVETYNPASRQDSSQPVFVSKPELVLAPRQLFFRCADEWSRTHSTVLTAWQAEKGISVLPFPYQPHDVFPVALSLTRDYPR